MENTKLVQIIIVTQTIYFLMAKNYRNIPITLVILPILSAKKFVQVIQGRIHLHKDATAYGYCYDCMKPSIRMCCIRLGRTYFNQSCLLAQKELNL